VNRKQLVVMIGVVALGAAGIGAGVAVAVSHGVSSQGTTSTAPVSPIYSYYRSIEPTACPCSSERHDRVSGALHLGLDYVSS
jgi:hypothetical protein